jgi:hypothetical protein
MVWTDPIVKPIDVDQLLLAKGLEPLAAEHQQRLQKIAALDSGTGARAAAA